MPDYTDIRFLESLEGMASEPKDRAIGLENHPNGKIVLHNYNKKVHEDWLLCQEKKEDILRAWSAGEDFLSWGCKDGWSWEAHAVKFPDPSRYGGALTFHLFLYGSSLTCGVYRHQGVARRVLVLR